MAEQRYQEMLASGANYKQWFVISSAQTPGQQGCNDIRNQYGLTMPVLMDPDGLLRTAMGHANSMNHWDYVLDEGGETTFRGQAQSQGNTIAPAIDAALAD